MTSRCCAPDPPSRRPSCLPSSCPWSWRGTPWIQSTRLTRLARLPPTSLPLHRLTRSAPPAHEPVSFLGDDHCAHPTSSHRASRGRPDPHAPQHSPVSDRVRVPGSQCGRSSRRGPRPPLSPGPSRVLWLPSPYNPLRKTLLRCPRTDALRAPFLSPDPFPSVSLPCEPRCAASRSSPTARPAGLDRRL